METVEESCGRRRRRRVGRSEGSRCNRMVVGWRVVGGRRRKVGCRPIGIKGVTRIGISLVEVVARFADSLMDGSDYG